MSNPALFNLAAMSWTMALEPGGSVVPNIITVNDGRLAEADSFYAAEAQKLDGVQMSIIVRLLSSSKNYEITSHTNSP